MAEIKAVELTLEEKAREKVHAFTRPVSAQDYEKLSPIEKAVAETEHDMERARKLMPKRWK